LAQVPSLDVVFVARGETLRVLRETGLSLLTTQGDTVIRSFTATDNLEEAGQVDVVLVCTKAWQVRLPTSPVFSTSSSPCMRRKAEIAALFNYKLLKVLPFACLLGARRGGETEGERRDRGGDGGGAAAKRAGLGGVPARHVGR
jgi:hypothetical protein